MIRPSAGTAKVLGLEKMEVETPPTCAYLLLGGRCQGRCLFCAQSGVARQGDFLSRVSWKPHDEEQVYDALSRCHDRGELARACFQVVREEGWLERTLEALGKVRGRSGVPLCVSINGVGIEDMQRLFDAGAGRIAVSFDAATPELYRKIKGDDYEEVRATYLQAASRFAGRIGVHLIAGLGEKEEEATRAMEDFYSHGTPVALFAFTPLPGTPMARVKPPPLSSYRRLQALHYLIRTGQKRGYSFDAQGRILFPPESLDWMQSSLPGEAFQTSGCPGCNRPLYNERPGRVPYNYPRPLTGEERLEAVMEVLAQLD